MSGYNEQLLHNTYGVQLDSFAMLHYITYTHTVVAYNAQARPKYLLVFLSSVKRWQRYMKRYENILTV